MVKNTEKKEFQIPTDLSEVQKASAKVLSFLRPLDLDEPCIFDIRLCLEEALINAMKYGNQLRKDLSVRLVVECDPGRQVRITVEDQGGGFDVRRLEDCTQKKNLFKGHGRGVYLIHQLMDEVKFNAKGNSVLMIKHLQSNKSILGGLFTWKSKR